MRIVIFDTWVTTSKRSGKTQKKNIDGQTDKVSYIEYVQLSLTKEKEIE